MALSEQTIEFMKLGYEGLEIFNDDFYTKDILIKTKLVIEGKYPSWSKNTMPKSTDIIEIQRLIKETPYEK